MQWIPTIVANKLERLLWAILSYICYKFQRRKYLKVSFVFAVCHLRTLNNRRISWSIFELFKGKGTPDIRPTTIWFCNIVSWKVLLDLLGTAYSKQKGAPLHLKGVKLNSRKHLGKVASFLKVPRPLWSHISYRYVEDWPSRKSRYLL